MAPGKNFLSKPFYVLNVPCFWILALFDWWAHFAAFLFFSPFFFLLFFSFCGRRVVCFHIFSPIHYKHRQSNWTESDWEVAKEQYSDLRRRNGDWNLLVELWRCVSAYLSGLTKHYCHRSVSPNFTSGQTSATCSVHSGSITSKSYINCIK